MSGWLSGWLVVGKGKVMSRRPLPCAVPIGTPEVLMVVIWNSQLSLLDNPSLPASHPSNTRKPQIITDLVKL